MTSKNQLCVAVMCCNLLVTLSEIIAGIEIVSPQTFERVLTF